MHVDQITEMAAVMRKAIEIDDRHGCKEQERIIQLEVSMKSKQRWHKEGFAFLHPPSVKCSELTVRQEIVFTYRSGCSCQNRETCLSLILEAAEQVTITQIYSQKL